MSRFLFSLFIIFSFLFYIDPVFAPVFSKVRSSGQSTVEPSKQNFELGMAKYKEHDLDGAIDAFLQSVYFARNTYNPEGYFWLGVAYQDKGVDAKAIEAFKKHVEQTIKPTPQAHLHLAQLYLRNNRFDEAEGEASKALADNKYLSLPPAHNIIGLICDKRGDLKRAQDEYIIALGDPPWRYTEAWMNYAENLMRQKEWASAIEQLRKMLNYHTKLVGMDPQRIYMDIGTCLLAKGDHQGAIDNWHEVLNYNPDNARAHLQLALLMDSERHISAAIKEYKEYIRLSSDGPETNKIKNQVLLLEQKLRSVPPDANPTGNTYSQRSPSDFNKRSPNFHDGIDETESSTSKNSSRPNKKKDVLEPTNKKESGF